MIKINKNTCIGWIGTGVMGFSMCQHFLTAGYSVAVFNRTQSKATKLIEQGALWCDSPQQIASRCDVIFTILGYPADVEQVYFSETGLFAGLKSNKIVVDMTTTKPMLAEKINHHAEKIGAFAIDAPVSGGDIGAKNVALSIMAGGEKAVFDVLKPLFEILGNKIIYHGLAGKGQHAKMCNQILVAGNMIGACECLLYGFKAGLNPDALIESVSSGAAASWSITHLGPRIVKRDFEPGFYVEHFIKDMSIALHEAQAMNLALPGLALVQQLYIALKAQGHGEKGTQALMLALEHLSKA
jgi:3-hydroxyisobutyrate dehydrogenase